MRDNERQRLIGILKDGLENGGPVQGQGIVKSPLSDYTSPELLAQERKVFFRETPLFMGLSADLPENGSYWADSEAGLPILMTRDDEGRFRAFANTCRHRGAQVVPDGRGTQVRFSCPFHAWTYGSRGNLIAVNKADRFGEIDKSEHGLIELPAAERYNMLWVKPTPGGEIDVDKCLGGLHDDMAHWNLDVTSYAASQVLHAKINWKLAIDTFGENYHFDVLHRESLSKDIRGNLQTHDTFGPNYRMVFAYNHFPEIAKQVPDQKDWPFRMMTLSVYFIYPNAIFLVDPHAVDVLRIFPDAENPAKSTTAHSYYALPEVRAYFEDPEFPERKYEQRFEDFNHIIVGEDYRMAESTQRCADTGIQSHILFGRNEPALLHYHNAHRRGLGRPLLEPLAVAADA